MNQSRLIRTAFAVFFFDNPWRKVMTEVFSSEEKHNESQNAINDAPASAFMRG